MKNYQCEFSSDKRYRYTLWRTNCYARCGLIHWQGDRETYVNYICLNPSTATDDEDDPTIRRLISFTVAQQFDTFCITNLFALRSTDPSVLQTDALLPIGEESSNWYRERVTKFENVNDYWIDQIARGARTVVCAWGEWGKLKNRGCQVLKMLLAAKIQPYFFESCRSGQPRHPLYLPGTLKPRPMDLVL